MVTIDELRAENERLRKALEYFANDLNWRKQRGDLGQPVDWIWDPSYTPFDKAPWQIAADVLRSKETPNET